MFYHGNLASGSRRDMNHECKACWGEDSGPDRYARSARRWIKTTRSGAVILSGGEAFAIFLNIGPGRLGPLLELGAYPVNHGPKSRPQQPENPNRWKTGLPLPIDSSGYYSTSWQTANIVLLLAMSFAGPSLALIISQCSTATSW